jgi:hypothetical protein
MDVIPHLRCSLVSVVALLGCTRTASGGEDGLEETGESSSEATDEADTGAPDLPPPPEELLGDNCKVEVLWSSNEHVLTDLTAAEPGEFFLTGYSYGSMAQVTLRVADGELDWSEVFGTVDSWGGSGPRVLRRPDGAVWVFAQHESVQQAWIIAYNPAGELLWESPWSGIRWLDVAQTSSTVFATALVLGRPDSGIVHRIDDQGASSWSFPIDGLEVRPNGVAVRGNDLWAVGGHYTFDMACAWRAHWTVDGQLASSGCLPDATDDHGDAYNDVLILADGSRVIGGFNTITKPTDLGHIYYSEPLVASLDEAGHEQARWTYGPGVYRRGEILDMAELPTGGFVAVSKEEESPGDDVLGPTIHRFSADIQHLARCELDRSALHENAGMFDRVEVGPDGDVHALLSEWTPGYPENKRISLVRIVELGD